MEAQPRHYVHETNEIDEDKLPADLKGRLSLETIHETPPGEIPDHLKINYNVKNFSRLTVLCDNGMKVKVDYLYYLSFTTFKREDGLWYLCHTWTRTWGDGSRSGSTFINLYTGERHDVESLSFWRGTLRISPDGNMILIDAGIMASSARKIIMYDISALPRVETIHYEEFWENVDYSISFNENNEFECAYFYIDDDEDLKKEVKIVRKRDISRQINSDQLSEYPTVLDETLLTCVGVNKMIEIKRIETDHVSLKNEIIRLLDGLSAEKYQKILDILKVGTD